MFLCLLILLNLMCFGSPFAGSRFIAPFAFGVCVLVYFTLLFMFFGVFVSRGGGVGGEGEGSALTSTKCSVLYRDDCLSSAPLPSIR